MTPSNAPDQRSRRDRCPGVLALHEAADGWLARVRVPGGRLTGHGMLALAEVSERLGNGLVYLTARANVQLRGLAPDAAAQLAAALGAAGLLPSAEHDRARNVLAGPLAGRAPTALDDVDAVVAQLDERLLASEPLRELPGRFCFLVDDGTGAGRETGPDVTVRARGGGRFGVALDGRALELDDDAAGATAVAVRAAEAFLRVGGDAWRMSETPGGPGTIARELGLALAGVARPAPTPVFGPGELQQRDGRVALTAIAPLGQLSPALLRTLAQLADDVRLSTRRTVTLVDVDPDAVAAVRARLEESQLVLDAESGWVGLTACAGTGACARALADVRAVAADRAADRAADEPPEHWAACERRCGELPGTPIAVTMHAVGDVEVRHDARTRRVESLELASALLWLGAAR